MAKFVLIVTSPDGEVFEDETYARNARGAKLIAARKRRSHGNGWTVTVKGA